MTTRFDRFCFASLLLLCTAPDAHAEDCARPSPPIRLDYETSEDYSSALEGYYSAASSYLDCLNQWTAEAEQRYRQMFLDEAKTYLYERRDVLAELRNVLATAHPRR